jgi:MraZ protein
VVIFPYIYLLNYKMTNFLGEYECKVDAKGRITLPSSLKRQVNNASQDRYVIHRGFEKCLILYPFNEWETTSAEVNKLNLYNKKNREFARQFHRGATELELDGTNRLLMPKRLLEYAGIGKDLILFAYSNRIEVWAKEVYENWLNAEPEDLSALAEEVMGKKKGNEDEIS